jgi:uncharacterized membrane protein
MNGLTKGRVIRIASPGHAAFALMMIALGVLGLIKRDFTVVWAPVPKGVPAREALVYLCALVSLGSGVGLLVRRSAAIAAGVLLALLVLWLAVWRVRALFLASLVEGTWSFGETLVMIAAAWVLFAWFGRGSGRFDLLTGHQAVRIARVLYGLGLIPFGYAHFAYLKVTADLVPRWLPWHVGWAYFTGATFIVAGVAIIIGVFGRLAAALSALQMALFFLLVWIPLAATRALSAFQWGEFVANLALIAAGWVVADSYRGIRGFGLAKR